MPIAAPPHAFAVRPLPALADSIAFAARGDGASETPHGVRADEPGGAGRADQGAVAAEPAAAEPAAADADAAPPLDAADGAAQEEEGTGAPVEEKTSAELALEALYRALNDSLRLHEEHSRVLAGRGGDEDEDGGGAAAAQRSRLHALVAAVSGAAQQTMGTASGKRVGDGERGAEAGVVEEAPHEEEVEVGEAAGAVAARDAVAPRVPPGEEADSDPNRAPVVAAPGTDVGVAACADGGTRVDAPSPSHWVGAGESGGASFRTSQAEGGSPDASAATATAAVAAAAIVAAATKDPSEVAPLPLRSARQPPPRQPSPRRRRLRRSQGHVGRVWRHDGRVRTRRLRRWLPRRRRGCGRLPAAHPSRSPHSHGRPAPHPPSRRYPKRRRRPPRRRIRKRRPRHPPPHRTCCAPA